MIKRFGEYPAIAGFRRPAIACRGVRIHVGLEPGRGVLAAGDQSQAANRLHGIPLAKKSPPTLALLSATACSS